MDVHGRAGLVLDGFGHEGCPAIVTQGGLTDHAFVGEDFVGQLQRITVFEVQFQLAGPVLLDDRVDL